MIMIEIDPNKQYILAGDISGSMDSPDAKCGNLTRYKYMLEKFEAFIKTSEDFDPDGPTVMLFGEKVHTFRNTNLEAVQSKLGNPNFEPCTNTADLIDEAYRLHKEEKGQLAKEGKSHQGTILMIFTDGAPTNRAAVERSIVRIANEIDRDEEFSISFLTVGTIAPDLKDFLTYLDDGLKDGKAKYDIVDVKEVELVSFIAAVEGALND
jgi:hypothetical protein